jgi:hypothetical protein
MATVSSREQPQTSFSLIPAVETNISFENRIEENEHLKTSSLASTSTTAGATGDFNNDGLQDLFCSGNTVAIVFTSKFNDIGFNAAGDVRSMIKLKFTSRPLVFWD